MKRLIFLAPLLAVGFAGGCECSGSAVEGSLAAKLVMPPVPDDVPQPGSVYREAYEPAKRDVTLDNAYETLDEIERQVAREREELR